MWDEQLTRLKGYISTGFPCDKKNLPTNLHQFWPHKEMLSIESGLITCGNRIIVPRQMRPEILQYIHEGHQGKERCLLRARNTIFWPKMTYDVQQLIKKCVICQEYGKSQSLIATRPFPMAHIGNRFVLLEKNGLSDSGRCILKAHHSEEITKSHLSSCVHRTVYDCHRIRPAPHNQK